MKTYDERMESVQKKLQRRRVQWTAIKATACLLCICLLVGVLLPHFRNSDVLEQYAQDPYYKVIAAINRDFQRKEDSWEYLHWEDLFWGDAFLEDESGSRFEEELVYAPGAVPDTDTSISGSANSSVEITDHQVAGVLEGDLIKRSETHIFYLNNTQLEIYEINGEDTKKINTVSVGTNWNSDSEMYLSADASRLTVIQSGYDAVFSETKKESYVQVISLDVSDPVNVTNVASFYLTGAKQTCRMVDDQLMLISRFCIQYEVDFDDPSTFLPQYGTPGNMQCIPADNIVIPDRLSDRYYTVVTLLDNNDLSLVDTGAFMSYSAELYVSKERIYATRSYSGEEKLDDNKTLTKAMTEVSCMDYDENGLTLAGSFSVEGTVKNQYSMDEHEGVFRIVTGTTQRKMINHETGYTSVQVEERNANLTCFEVGTWEQLAQAAKFAPEGETVESVRFDGDYAYVCTAVVVTLTDPVFFFDMTDLGNITVKDTGTIDGYSSSLIQLNDGFLLGIGFNDNWNMKVEVYTESADGVKPVCEYIYEGSFASEYKAYFIDRENNLFGIPVMDGYVLLQFDGYELREIAKADIGGSLNFVRGVVIDQYLYVCSPGAFDVVNLA
ncbi:MAG: hypothetical protein E7455_04315 [Ruminococcaceae bacterium]|nr:hypothetical protein [Oscillospiraceae bacterium]